MKVLPEGAARDKMVVEIRELVSKPPPMPATGAPVGGNDDAMRVSGVSGYTGSPSRATERGVQPGTHTAPGSSDGADAEVDDLNSHGQATAIDRRRG